MSSPMKFRWAVTARCTAHTNTPYPAICLSTRHISICLVLSVYTFHKIHRSAATYLIRSFTRAWPYTRSVAVRLHTFESSALDTGLCTGSHSRQFFSLRNNSRARSGEALASYSVGKRHLTAILPAARLFTVRVTPPPPTSPAFPLETHFLRNQPYFWFEAAEVWDEKNRSKQR
jgi:hypothetical protein